MPSRMHMVKRLSSVAALALLPFLCALPSSAQTAQGQPSTAKGDWPMYFADPSGSRYSPLDQINASNFNRLQQAWHFKTDNLGGRPEFKLEGTPLEINGTIYTTGGSRRDVIALNAKTGELKWVYGMEEGARAALAPRQLSGRGVSYWSDGNGDERILYVTTGYRLIELDAHTGRPIESFGDHGVVDLKVGVIKGANDQIDLQTGEIGLHTTPTVVNNVVILGSAMKEGSQPLEVNNSKGLVRAFDVKTGKLIWTFRTIPQKGEFGYDTWENGSADKNGNTGVWTGITVDPELNSVYLPVEDPTNDFYGGARPGNNLFGDSLVCVDLHTGKMKWYFQVVHHPIWDYDLSSPPLLVDITVKGKAIKAVAVPSKEAFLYVFDRVTGKPIWPIVEKPVPQSDVPGEKTSKTQPFPTRPAPYARQAITTDDLIDFTPELRAKAVDMIKKYYKMGPMFSPAIVSKVGGPYGVIDIANLGGGTNWPGAGLTDNRYLEGVGGQPFRIAGGPGFGSATDAPKVSADDAKLAAALAAHPETAAGPPPPRNI